MPTEVSNQLDRIEGAVVDIKTAIGNRGVTVPSGTKINGLATLISSIPTAQPKLQNKTVNPDYTTKTVTADDGYDGLGAVTVTKIPLSYADTSSGDAVAGDIRKDKVAWVDGYSVTGTMPIYSAVKETLGIGGDGSWTTSYTIPEGYHDGTTEVAIKTQSVIVRPRKNPDVIVPYNGCVISDVQVQGEPNLVENNIKKGVTIFGVTGTHEGGASVATCNVTIAFGASVGYVRVVATTFENGEIKKFNLSKNSGSFSIQNVVCGSMMVLGGGTFDVSYNYEIGSVGSSVYLVAPSAAGDYTATIIEYED